MTSSSEPYGDRSDTPAAPPSNSILPSAATVAQASAFGAALSGVTVGITDTMMVRAGGMTVAEASRDVAKASLQGAVTMGVASAVAHMVRARPLIGLGLLAAVGVGALMMMGAKDTRVPPATKRRTIAKQTPAPQAKPAAGERKAASKASSKATPPATPVAANETPAT